MYLFRLANPQRGEPPLLFPQAKYFTVKVPFTPADLDAAVQAMACDKTQFGAETMQRFLARARSSMGWRGLVCTSVVIVERRRPFSTVAPRLGDFTHRRKECEAAYFVQQCPTAQSLAV